MMINELKVYRSRYPSLTVSVGSEATNDIRYQNPNPSTYGAKIKSIVNDEIGNLSAIAYHDLNVDWTAPSNVIVYDGVATDVDTITVTSSLSANWTNSIDENSDISKYWYSIGTIAGATDIINWTNNGINTSVTQNGLSLLQGQTYFINVKAENNAGLFSNIISSDGQMVAGSTVIGFTSSANEICAGDSVIFTNTSMNANSFVWTFDGGTPSTSTDENPIVIYNSEGNFDVQIQANGLVDTLYLNESNLVNVNALPIANFTVNDTLVELPGALVLFENLSENTNSYLWNFGDESFTTDFAPWHIYDTLGYYSITLIAYSNSCGSDTLISHNLIHVDVIDNNEWLKKSNISIYPNPFSDNLTIEYSCTKNEEIGISLIDMQGKEIYLLPKKEYIAGKYEYSLSTKDYSLTDGVYFLKILKNEQSLYYKIVRE